MAKKQKIIIQERDNSVFLIPVFLILLIAPTIVFMRAVEQSEMAMQFWKGGKVTYDFFCYYKTFVLRIGAIIGIVFFLTQKFLTSFKFKFEKILIPFLIFLILGLFSTLASNFPEFAWLGFPDRFEGYLSILSYSLCMYMIYDLGDHSNVKRWIFRILICIATLLSLIGIFQYYHLDFFQTQFGKELILPTQFEHAASKLSFHQSNPVYMTLYQSNFAGSFTAMMFSMSFAGLFFLQGKKRYLLVALHLLIFSVFIGCDSRAGLVGGLAGLFISLFFLKNYILKNIKLLVTLLLLYPIIIYLLMLRPGPKIFARATSDGITTNSTGAVSTSQPLVLESIDLEKDNAIVITNKYKMKVHYNGQNISVFDDKGTFLPISMPGQGIVQINDSRYQGVIFRLIRDPAQHIYIQYTHGTQIQITLAFPQGHFAFYDLARKKMTEPAPIRTVFSDKYISVGSNRGYIWSRAIPLLADNIFIGSGFDTFAAFFPQHDYAGKMKAWGITNIIVEKPHNFFLDIGLSAGVCALISFLTFLFWHYKKSVTLIRKHFQNPLAQINFVLMLGTVAYLVSGQFNDSLVSISIIFWIMLGLMLNINSQLSLLKLQKSTQNTQ